MRHTMAGGCGVREGGGGGGGGVCWGGHLLHAVAVEQQVYVKQFKILCGAAKVVKKAVRAYTGEDTIDCASLEGHT